jgi:[ribosomal protein S18]-alanine N-acetyltransferase
MAEVIYAPMTASDINDILTLHKECDLESWTKEGYLSSLNNPEFIAIVVKFNSKIVGFITTRLITNNNLCEILNIAVTPSQKHKKIGEGLLLELFKQLGDKIERIWLEVRESNHPAISFYEKHGFQIVGKRNNFYRDPAENALLMQKTIG